MVWLIGSKQFAALREATAALGRDLERQDDRIGRIEQARPADDAAIEAVRARLEEVAARVAAAEGAAAQLAARIDALAADAARIAARLDDVAAAGEARSAALDQAVDKLERRASADADAARTAATALLQRLETLRDGAA